MALRSFFADFSAGVEDHFIAFSSGLVWRFAIPRAIAICVFEKDRLTANGIKLSKKRASREDAKTQRRVISEFSSSSRSFFSSLLAARLAGFL
ncbi:MAG: hypothetical protein SF339_07825, partial [Blastocatellia bacterium]|nr:hypothetical protein [Blastocatellia bacterium]